MNSRNFLFLSLLFCPVLGAQAQEAVPSKKTNRNNAFIERAQRAAQIDGYIGQGFGAIADSKLDAFRMQSEDDKKLKQERNNIVSEYMNSTWEGFELYSPMKSLIKTPLTTGAPQKDFLDGVVAKRNEAKAWNLPEKNKGMATYMSFLSNSPSLMFGFMCPIIQPVGGKGLTQRERPQYSPQSLSAEKTLAQALASYDVMKDVKAPLEIAPERFFLEVFNRMLYGARPVDLEALKNNKTKVLEIIKTFEKKINESREEFLAAQYDEDGPYAITTKQDQNSIYQSLLFNLDAAKDCLNAVDGTSDERSAPAVGQRPTRDQVSEGAIVDMQVSERVCDNFMVLRKIYSTYTSAGLVAEAEKIRDLLKDVAVCTDKMDNGLREKLEQAISNYKRVTEVFRAPEATGNSAAPRVNKK